MSFFRFLIDKSLFVHYLTILIVALGVLTLFSVQREARPNVNFNRVAVSAFYPGASPADIEELVIDPIEERIDSVDGVEEYRSVSFTGAGAISVKIDDDYPNPKEVVDELRRQIGQVRDLPDVVEDPVITEIKAENIPVLRLALYGQAEPLRFKLEVEKLRDFIKTFDGIQSVNYEGIEDLQLKIQTQPEQLDRFDMTLVEVINGLNQWSKQKPGGLFESPIEASNITVGRDYSEIEMLKNFVVRSNDSGQSVALKDISKIEYGTERVQKESIFEDKTAVLMTVVKNPNADIVSTTDRVREALEKYRVNLPEGLEYKLYTDESERVRSRLGTVTSNAVFGLVFVALILILSLDWRSSIVTAVGIPVAILGGITIIYLLGSTINTLVVVGMIIVLGMLVDDAIVVCENIYRYVEEGLSPKEAAVKGTSEIAIPVVATVLTTIFAFFPILFMKEIIGQFLRVIPMTVIAMLVVSLFEALIILPIHAQEIMKPKREKKKISFFTRLEERYRVYLHWSIKRRWLILGATTLFMIISMVQGAFLFQKFTLFPASGLNGLNVRVELSKNTPVSETAIKVKELSAELKKVSQGTFDSLYATVGQVRTGGAAGSQQNASHLAMINIVFVSDPDFIYKEKEIVKNIRKVTAEYASQNKIKTSVAIDRPGPPIGKPIQVEVASRSFEKGNEIVSYLKSELEKIKGTEGLETDSDGDSKKYRFVVDNSYAVSEGVNPNDISRTIFAASTGLISNEILKDNEKVELLVSTDSSRVGELKDILDLKVRNNNGQSLPVKSFVKVEEEFGPSSIQRLNGLRTITLFGEVDEKVITGKEVNAMIRPIVAKLRADNPSVKIKQGGGEQDRINALRDTMKLYIIAILIIFMVISLSFNSVVYPFLVLIAIPFGLCGVVWSLVLHGQVPSLMAFIGVIGLSGVVVNVSIILLSFVQTRIQQGFDFNDAIIEAGVRRLRAIAITTVTTLIGLAPTIYGWGGLDTFIQPLALVLGWGLFVATLMTVLALPAMISFMSFLGHKKSPANS